jgi:integrase/recombinase XerD
MLPACAMRRKTRRSFKAPSKSSARLSGRAIHVNGICRMMKRRLKDFEMTLLYSPHSFRVNTITDLLEPGVPLGDVQRLTGHASPRTTNLCDRREQKVKKNIVDKTSV